MLHVTIFDFFTVGRLGFDETHSKKFRLSFEMHGSPTDNLLRDCSYRMLRIRHLYQILMEIGLTNLAQAYLKDFGKLCAILFN